ncbi:MAG: zinc-ribbon domain-containing protein [Candidatus Bathyarchaeia archaeon]|nr:zinc-ribbon domain-containing protein [Candidatus Bathyarchaeota archaeon]
MVLTKILKRRDESASSVKEQKIFSCPNCNNELFLNMRFCDKCGSRIEWPEEYHYIINLDRRGEMEQMKLAPSSSG